MPPNVLWIVFDTARADGFEGYGAPAGSTPTFSDVASRGQLVSRAYSPSNWTMPAHASMFTGLLPRTLGLSRAPNGQGVACKPIIESHAGRFFPEVLRRAGYATAAASANAWISPGIGFDLGFERFVRAEGRRYQRIQDPSLKARVRWAIEAVIARVDDGARAAEEAIHGWLDDRSKQPFFWFVNLVECHSPYLPPTPYNDLSVLGRFKAGEEARRYLTLGYIWRACAGSIDVPDEAFDRMRHLYGRAIRLMDDWLCRVLEELDRRGVLDDTIVIVTSDHGENFGECNLMGHALSLDDRLIKVPLLFAGPDAPAPSGVTSLTELPRLLAGALDLKHNPWADDRLPVDAAVAQYEGPFFHDLDKAREVADDWGVGVEGLRRLTVGAACATDGDLKLVRTNDREEHIFDLTTDPLEHAPLATSDGVDGEGLARLRAALDLAEETRSTAVGEVAPDDIEGLEDRLRLLGYL